MLTQQTFDGTTLEAALARVSEEVGPSARITQAEKIRSGGLGGFFARERFEVTVEIDDHSGAEEPIAPEQPAASGTPAAVTLLDLAEQVSHQERITTLPGVREEMPDGAEVAEVWPRTPLVGNDPDLPLPSTEGTTFHEVLRGIASEAGLLHPATGTAGSAPEELVPAGGGRELRLASEPPGG